MKFARLNFCPVVYLCGGINGLSDSDCRDWREYAKTLLPRTLDPMRRDYRGIEDLHTEHIVSGDLDDIAKSNVVLAMCNRPSWGTAMEIFHSHHLGRMVVSVVPPDTRVSPWLRYHSFAIRTSVDAAVDEIKRFYTW